VFSVYIHNIVYIYRPCRAQQHCVVPWRPTCMGPGSMGPKSSPGSHRRGPGSAREGQGAWGAWGAWGHGGLTINPFVIIAQNAAALNPYIARQVLPLPGVSRPIYTRARLGCPFTCEEVVAMKTSSTIFSIEGYGSDRHGLRPAATLPPSSWECGSGHLSRSYRATSSAKAPQRSVLPLGYALSVRPSLVRVSSESRLCLRASLP
jgi:hypothetical protein